MDKKKVLIAGAAVATAAGAAWFVKKSWPTLRSAAVSRLSRWGVHFGSGAGNGASKRGSKAGAA